MPPAARPYGEPANIGGWGSERSGAVYGAFGNP